MTDLPLQPPKKPVRPTLPEETKEAFDPNSLTISSPKTDFEEEIEELSEDLKEGINSLPLESRVAAKKLLDLIGEEGVSEILMNGPQEILFKKDGHRFFIDDIKFADVKTYHDVINYVLLPISHTEQRIGDTGYLIEGQLEMPDPLDATNIILARIHIVAPPAVKTAKVTIAKKARYQYTLDEIREKNTMSSQMEMFLKAVAKGRVTTVFSGLSGSGKTTLLEGMSFEFDPSDRVIVVEETPELRLPLEDVVYLPAHSAKPGQDMKNSVSVEWLAAQANRMRPDRIIVGEVRGIEAREFILAANSGADGSMTTVHAGSPRQALDKLVSLSMKDDNNKSELSIVRDIASTVQLIIQTNLVEGRHVISQIEEISKTIRKEGSSIATTTLFEYDRMNDTFKAMNRPSEELVHYMAARGVPVNLSWFV